MTNTITVHKLDHDGQPLWQYQGTVLSRSADTITLEAHFNREDHATEYHTFKKGDRFVEWFFSDRWYNIFAMHHRNTDELEGWYCNITRPARFEDNAIYADDLALDVMVYPDGRTLILDEDDFASLDIDAATRQHARAALHELLTHIEQRWGPFREIATP
ncbi:MAG: DUF402 domain-containing protein [Chloroflexi bacterium]|nr:DUF402 domain-containing protein [Chloroflexota bacterium]